MAGAQLIEPLPDASCSQFWNQGLKSNPDTVMTGTGILIASFNAGIHNFYSVLVYEGIKYRKHVVLLPFRKGEVNNEY